MRFFFVGIRIPRNTYTQNPFSPESSVVKNSESIETMTSIVRLMNNFI